jgi:hypothetical protein
LLGQPPQLGSSIDHRTKGELEMAQMNDHRPGPAEKPWTVVGTYYNQELGSADAEEGPFVRVFWAEDPREAQSLAIEYEPWLSVAAVFEGAIRPVI